VEIARHLEAGGSPEDGLALRARAVALAGRCAHAGLVASAGAGNTAGHPAQRIYREALAFTVLGLDPQLQAAAVHRLARADGADPR